MNTEREKPILPIGTFSARLRETIPSHSLIVGDLLFFDPNATPQPGDLVFVQHPEKEATLAEVGDEGELIDLISRDVLPPSERQWYKIMGCRIAYFRLLKPVDQEGAAAG